MSGKAKFIWRFPPARFAQLPSCQSNAALPQISTENELSQRQELAVLIYHLGSHLNVSFNCIYTAVIYMHRFFMLHSFQQCLKESVAGACLFLACKINEMPRPLTDFARCLYQFLHLTDDQRASSSTSPLNNNEILSSYHQQIIEYENILLSTLGFSLHVEQPYLIISKTSQSLSISLDVAQQAQEIATKSIFFTRFPMKYTNNLIACFALYLASRSSKITIPDHPDGSQWFHLLNEEFTEKLLQELVDEYQLIAREKSSQKSQLRFEQIREEKKISGGQWKTKSTDLHPDPIATTSGSVRSTALLPPSSNLGEQDSTAIPSSSPGVSVPVAPRSSSSVSCAQPIPTLMSSANGNTFHGSRHHSRFSTPIFSYTSSPQRPFRPPPPPPLPHYHHPPPPPAYLSTAHFYPQQQTPLFYHHQYPIVDPSLLVNHKRYTEPPAPPSKRPRYHLNVHQPY